jgi:hypothetical protein
MFKYLRHINQVPLQFQAGGSSSKGLANHGKVVRACLNFAVQRVKFKHAYKTHYLNIGISFFKIRKKD